MLTGGEQGGVTREENKQDIKRAINFLQKAMLATAISALRAKRRNAKNLREHNIIGNETLRDICLLMECFQHKDKFDLKTLDVVMEVATGLQSELDVISTPAAYQKVCFSVNFLIFLLNEMDHCCCFLASRSPIYVFI